MSHQDSREKSIGRIARPVALSPIFTKRVNLHWGIVPYSREWCSETDPRASILQHNRAHSQSHLKKWLFSLPRGLVLVVHTSFLKLLNLLNFLNLWGGHGRPAPGARHRRAHFAIGLLGVFKIAPMANYSELSFKSSEIGTLMSLRLRLQRSSVLPTRAFSESISNVNLSFCT